MRGWTTGLARCWFWILPGLGAAEVPVERVRLPWQGPSWRLEAGSASLHWGKDLSALTWQEGPASFGSGLAVASGTPGDPRPWLMVGARAWSVEGRRTGGVLGFRWNEVLGAWSSDFGVGGGLGDSFFGDELVVIRDVNGDGREDVLVFSSRPFGDLRYSGGWSLFLSDDRVGGWQREPVWVLGCRVPVRLGFGTMASAGDVNGDGFGDVLIGVPNAAGEAGMALVYHGSPEGLGSVPDVVLEGELAGDLFGFGVGGVGDWNGDGYDDVMVGAPGSGEGGSGQGRVAVYLGGPTGLGSKPIWSMAGTASKGWWGGKVQWAGDVNRDGWPEVWVGAPGPVPKRDRDVGWTGRVYLVTAKGLEGSPAVVGDWGGRLHSHWFGKSFGMVGDMDGDGWQELAVGVPRMVEQHVTQGRVEVFSVLGDFSMVPRRHWDGWEAGQRYGWQVAGGDFNGDGYADLVGSGPFHRPASPNSGQGMVRVVWGGPEVFPPMSVLESGPVEEGRLAEAGKEARLEVEAGVGEDVNRRDVKDWEGSWVWWGMVVAGVGCGGVVGLVCWWRKREGDLVRRERLRIARDLHDQVGGHLTGIALRSGQLRRTLDGGGQQVGEQLATIEATAGQLVDHLSEIVWLARPANDTFEHLVRYLLDYAVRILEPAEITCQFEVPVNLPSVPLESGLRQDLLMSVKEALHNVLKHARASRVTVRVEVVRGRVGLEIEDNGVGLGPMPGEVRGNGLRHMRERMGRHGGGVELTSGEGRTRVRFTVPMGSRVRVT